MSGYSEQQSFQENTKIMKTASVFNENYNFCFQPTVAASPLFQGCAVPCPQLNTIEPGSTSGQGSFLPGELREKRISLQADGTRGELA